MSVIYSRERQRRYASTDEGQERRRLASQRYRASEKGKADEAARRRTPQFKARQAARKAVRAGKLIPKPCEVCGEIEVVKHHHLGYEPEHWLDVTWLCRPCHAAAHLGE